ncbi:hypothetical protein AB0B10_25850 [Micromonospora arborensis]|uniref:hypothetical protein n=1 Tax=Micromonospora arborensis TaxID=2116518 RepID=UPI0033F1B06E
MATPPRVNDDRAAQAVHDIAARRAAIDDPNRDRLGDDPLDVLLYLRKFSGASVPDAVREADIEDGLRLRIWLWWQGAAMELWLLDRAEDLGVNRKRLGRLLGIRTGQGLVDRRDRLRALLGPAGRPDEKISRAERAEQRSNASREDRQRHWLRRNHRAVATVARALVAHQELADGEAADWLVEVARDLREQTCTPASFTVVDLAVDAMVTVEAVAELPDQHALRQALRQWQSLAAQYRGIQRAEARRNDSTAVERALAPQVLPTQRPAPDGDREFVRAPHAGGA